MTAENSEVLALSTIDLIKMSTEFKDIYMEFFNKASNRFTKAISMKYKQSIQYSLRSKTIKGL
jgi:hypothetical protein